MATKKDKPKITRGKPSGDRSKRMAKNKEDVARKRTTAAGGPNQTTRPVSRSAVRYPYMNSQSPAQMMSGYQPPMGNPNPWGRRW